MKTVAISTEILARLIDRLEARIPEPTGPMINPVDLIDSRSSGQWEVDRGIEKDRALVDEARHLLRPRFKQTVDDFSTWTLEELRMGREVALKNGNAFRALALATAIDIKRGLYK